ncbi:MAG: hypothetical protein EB100_06000 [Crocinitomicaceae bacterium]|nr:hypothetical protein [Crocinitomicaceae bacterium]
MATISCSKDKVKITPITPIVQDTTTSLATIATGKITQYKSDSVLIECQITNDGKLPVLAKGVVYSETSNPTLVNSKTNNGSGKEAFTAAIKNGLIVSKTYYVKPYVTNARGTSYGNELQFTITNDNVITINLPTVSSENATSITQTSANISSNVISDGGAVVTERGIVFSTSTNPTLTNTKLTNTGTGTGVFSTNITNLSPATTYFVKAYATNSKGTAYSNQISFTTLSTPSFVSYSNDIAPILSLQCVGCHNNLNNHTGVSNWSSKSLIEMKNGSMPPNGQLPTGFIKKFEDWITQGKKNN